MSAFVERIELAMRNVGLAFFKGFGVKDLLRDMSDMLTGAGGSIDNLAPHFHKLREIFDILVAAGQAVGSSVVGSLDRMVQAVTGSGVNWNDTKEAAKQFVETVIIGIGNMIDMLKKFGQAMVRNVLMPMGDVMKMTGMVGEKSLYGKAREDGQTMAAAGFISAGMTIQEWFKGKEWADKELRSIGLTPAQNPFQSIQTAMDALANDTKVGTEALAEFRKQMGLISTTADYGEQEFWKMKLEEEKNQQNSLWGAWFSPVASATNTGTEGLLRVVQALPGEVTKLVEKVRKDIETEGTTDYDKFATNIDRLFKAANYPMPLKEGVIGPGLPAINEQELAFGVASQFEEFSKGLSKSMTTMPPAARFGSTEAAETINRSMVDQKSTMEEVRMAIVLGNQMAAERKKRLDEILAAVRANKGGIVVAKPPGNGK
jgi:hypothetical protein